MNRNLWRLTCGAILIAVLAPCDLSLGQQRPLLGQSQVPGAPRQQSGNATVERAANLQPAASEGWQPGQEPPRGGQLPAGQRGAAPGTNPQQRSIAPQPQMPFTLTPQEEFQLDQILLAWQKQSSTIKTYKCDFTRWEYGIPFDRTPLPKDAYLTKAEGELKYSAPDKGMFKVASIELLNTKSGQYDKGGPENLEHWVCDGRSIFQIDHKEKTRTERPLPPEMQGKAISDGPLPFVFGAKAATLKQRYWMRDITPPNSAGTIWLEAHPRYQADAANFKYVEVILSSENFMPQAIKMYSPAYDPSRGNESSTVFTFANASFNRPLANFFGDFVEPPLPFGYKKIVLQPAVEQPAARGAQPTRGNERSARAPGGKQAR